VQGTAKQNHDDGKSILEAFAKWQTPADQKWSEFLSRVDGEGGFAVIETANQSGLLDGVSKFVTWLEFDIVPVVDIMDGYRPRRPARSSASPSDATVAHRPLSRASR